MDSLNLKEKKNLFDDNIRKEKHREAPDEVNHFSSEEFIYSKNTDERLLAANEIYETDNNSITIFYSNLGYYQPELEILKAALKVLGIKYTLKVCIENYLFVGITDFTRAVFVKECNTKDEGLLSAADGKLPVLKIDQHFFSKEQFLPIIIKIFYEKPLEDGNLDSFYNLQIVELCSNKLNFATSYFMWVKPAFNYKYRDPYWFLINPIKKVEHILDIKSLLSFLKINGFHNENIAFQRGKKVLEVLETIIKERGTLQGKHQNQKAKVDLLDLIAAIYLKSLLENTPGSLLEKELEGKHSQLKTFMNKILDEVTSLEIAAEPTQIKMLSPSKKAVPPNPKKEEDAKEALRKKIPNRPNEPKKRASKRNTLPKRIK